MSWIVEDRRHSRIAAGQPLLTDELKRRVESVYFPRYPTKRACLLPVLHLVQHEYGWIPPQALQEVGEFLGLAPAEVLDTASFYEEYWLKKKGKYLVQVCRSLSCEVCGADRIIEGLVERLGIEVGETTENERFTLVELECLGSCGTAPVALVNDVLHEDVTLDGLLEHLARLPEDPHDYHDPAIDFDVPFGNPPGGAHVAPEGASLAQPASVSKTAREPTALRAGAGGRGKKTPKRKPPAGGKA